MDRETQIAAAMAGALAATPACACAPPTNFVNPSAPQFAPESSLVSRTDQIVIDQDRRTAIPLLDRAPLKDLLPKTDALPGVVGHHMLTPGEFYDPGSRRLVCLSDGSYAVEQVLERFGVESFKYLVWNYTSPSARPIHYGIGEFRYFDEGPNRTRVVWTYSFKLNEQEFPGRFGTLGRFLFRLGFLDRVWAKTMSATLATMKAYVEDRSLHHLQQE